MFRLHHLTDSHHSRPESRLRHYVDALARGTFGPLPDALLHTGDLVEGAPDPTASDAPDLLRAQHLSCRALLAATGLPIHALAHTHDRRGDPTGHWGATFREVWQQPLAQIVPCPDNLDLILISGSVTLPPLSSSATRPAPAWGFDIFDPHVLDTLATLVASHARPDSYRVLCTHLPVLVPSDFPRPSDRYRRPPIGSEGVARVLPILSHLGIRHVLGGHLHVPFTVVEHGIEFIVGPSTLGEDAGYGDITWQDGVLNYTRRHLGTFT
jgi:hypothetical protein